MVLFSDGKNRSTEDESYFRFLLLSEQNQSNVNREVRFHYYYWTKKWFKNSGWSKAFTASDMAVVNNAICCYFCKSLIINNVSVILIVNSLIWG